MKGKITHYKLFEFPGSRSDRVRWALHETIGDDFEAEVIQLFELAHYDPAYQQMNPNRNVPLLALTFEDGSTRYMGESAAIVGFLADGFPEKGLAPPPDALSAERSDYLHMLHFGGSWVDMILWQIRMQEHLIPDVERDQATIARYRTKFKEEIEPQLVTRFAAHPYLCGDVFLAADIVMGQNVYWAQIYGLCEGPVFDGYLRRLAERPAFRKTIGNVGGHLGPRIEGYFKDLLAGS